MPTTYTDQAYFINLSAPPPVGTVLDFATIAILDRNDDGIIGPATGAPGQRDRVEGQFVTRVHVGDTLTVRLANGDVVTITGVTFYTNSGSYFTPTDGTILQSGVTYLGSTSVNTSTSVPVSTLLPICFAPGTLIRTPEGEVPVEALEVGDLVTTLDNGPQPVRWVGRKTFPGTGSHAPVRFAAGALGNVRDLLVSPQHRMLVRGWRAELYAGIPEVMVAAVHMVNDSTIVRAPCPSVTYLHFMLERHEIVFAEGAETESLDPAGDAATDREIHRLVADRDASGRVRPALRAWEGRAIAL